MKTKKNQRFLVITRGIIPVISTGHMRGNLYHHQYRLYSRLDDKKDVLAKEAVAPISQGRIPKLMALCCQRIREQPSIKRSQGYFARKSRTWRRQYIRHISKNEVMRSFSDKGEVAVPATLSQRIQQMIFNLAKAVVEITS